MAITRKDKLPGHVVVVDTSADSLTVGGGVVAGTGAVQLVDATGKISALSSTTLANLSGANLTSLDAGNVSAGTLAVARGGSGQTSYTNGQLLIGNTTGNTLAKATLTAGTNVTITNGAGTITIASAGGVDAYVATLADVANTASETTAVSFTVPGGEWADGEVISVYIADLHKNNKGTDGTVTAKVNVGAGAQVTLVNAQIWSDGATEYKRASGAFSMMRVGSDVWVYSGVDLSSGVIAAVAGGAAGVSTPTNFTGDNLVSLKITLSAADATFYYKPQVACVIKYPNS